MSPEKKIFRQPTCPWWFLFTFDNPLRKLYQDPISIFSPLIRKGDQVADLGCGMGYFSLPLARLVGERGQVISIDLQPRMLKGLERRAERAGLRDRITIHRSTQDEIGYGGQVDFVLAFWMIHEVHNARDFLDQIWEMLKNQGRLLIVEPYLHVSDKDFRQTEKEVLETGFLVVDRPEVGFSRTLLVRKGI